jgi:AraC family transcriptional regulator of arabinose operon
MQPYVQLVMIHTGRMTVWIDDVPREAEAGTVSVLLPGHRERFAFAVDQETHHSWLHALVPDISDAVYARFSRLPWPLPLSHAMHGLLREAFALRASSLSTARTMLQALAAQMLWRYIGEGERILSGLDPTVHPAVERVQQFIDAHLGEQLTLVHLAGAAAMSHAHVTRLFHTHLRQTPMAYLWKRRIARGIDLLEHTGLTVGEIARHCGFQTSDHFSRRVRQATGRSPLNIRRARQPPDDRSPIAEGAELFTLGDEPADQGLCLPTSLGPRLAQDG